MRGSLLSKSGLMALAFGEAAAAAAASDDDVAAPAAPAAASAAAAQPAAEGGDGAAAEGPAAEAPAAAEAAPIDPGAAEAGDTVLASVALEGMAEARAKGRDEGYAAANERCRIVFESAEGQANPTMAAFLLFNSDAKAGDVVAKLKSAPAAAAPAGQRATAQPRIDLTGGNGARTATTEGEGGGDGLDRDDMWAQVQGTGKYGANGGVAAGAGPTIVIQPAQ